MCDSLPEPLPDYLLLHEIFGIGGDMASRNPSVILPANAIETHTVYVRSNIAHVQLSRKSHVVIGPIAELR